MPRVLIIDDEDEIRNILSDFFEDQKFSVHTARNGNQALQVLDHEIFDLIVSDFKMPQLNGLELTKILHDRKSVTPIIWLSGYASLESYREGLKNGLFEFIEKPFKIKDLQEAVDKAIAFGKTHTL